MTHCPITRGVDTLCYYHPLTSDQKDAMVKKLKSSKGFYKDKSDYFSETKQYHSDAYIEWGVKIFIRKCSNVPWHLQLIVHPEMVLGDADRAELWMPSKSDYKEISSRITKILHEAGLKLDADQLSLTRVDLTANLQFPEQSMVDEYLRILKKGILLPHYRPEKFHEKEHKAKNCKLANTHSYKQSCKSSAFFAYDKVSQLEMIDCISTGVADQHILRLEIQLSSKGMTKWLKKDDKRSAWKTIHTLSAQHYNILTWYLSRILPSADEHVQYSKAEALLEKLRKSKTKEHLQYFLRKQSDCKDLQTALEKTAEKFNLNKSKTRKLLEKCRKIEFNPITLTNGGEYERLPSLLFILKRNAHWFS